MGDTRQDWKIFVRLKLNIWTSFFWDKDVELEKKNKTTWAQFHGSAYRWILRLQSRFPAYVQAPNFCASLVSVECLVTWSTHAQKPKFALTREIRLL